MTSLANSNSNDATRNPSPAVKPEVFQAVMQQLLDYVTKSKQGDKQVGGRGEDVDVYLGCIVRAGR